MPRHFHDDDDDVPFVRPAEDAPSSTGLVLALIFGGLAILGLVAAGLVGVFFLRFEAQSQALNAEEAAAQASLALALQNVAVQDLPDNPNAGPLIEFNPPATEGTPTDLGPEREPLKQGIWTLLFVGDDAAYWDTTGNEEHYAAPVSRAPAGTRYLKLKRMDTDETIIVDMTKDQLRRGAPAEDLSVRWNGTNKAEYGGRHLGVIQGPRLPFMTNQGQVSVMNDGFDAFAGSGFGHKHHVDGAGQRYAWRGQEIPKTAFEIAVTDQDLSEDEQKLLVGDK